MKTFKVIFAWRDSGHETGILTPVSLAIHLRFKPHKQVGVDCKTVRIFAYSSTREQPTKGLDWGWKRGARQGRYERVRLARFARVILLRYAKPILRKKPTVLQCRLFLTYESRLFCLFTFKLVTLCSCVCFVTTLKSTWRQQYNLYPWCHPILVFFTRSLFDRYATYIDEFRPNFLLKS